MGALGDIRVCNNDCLSIYSTFKLHIKYVEYLYVYGRCTLWVEWLFRNDKGRCIEAVLEFALPMVYKSPTKFVTQYVLTRLVSLRWRGKLSGYTMDLNYQSPSRGLHYRKKHSESPGISRLKYIYIYMLFIYEYKYIVAHAYDWTSSE